MPVLKATVDPQNCVGSDRLPIFYTLDFDVSRMESSRYNAEKMNLDRYLAVLRHTLGLQPVPMISTQKDLDGATKLFCEALSTALDDSTPKYHPSSLAKRDFYRAIVNAKQAAWYAFVKDLERINVFKTLNRLRGKRSSVFTPIRDVVSGEVVLSHLERGRVLGHVWFGDFAVDIGADAVETPTNPTPEVTPVMRVDQTGNGTRREQGGAFTEASTHALLGILSTVARSGQYRAILYDKLIRTALALRPDLRITNLWTPAHIGTVANELADMAAKATTRLQTDPTIPISLTTVKRRIKFSFPGGDGDTRALFRDGKPILSLPEPESALHGLLCLAYPAPALRGARAF
ncbi:hypothetical protein DFH09DRAFT_1313632 [Mycena vulgaris]|nr:hypothetical protein DFH09DRAFT_1313632 [Mycena vulgaris]